jgi:hypothetical protein
MEKGEGVVRYLTYLTHIRDELEAIGENTEDS